MWQLSASSEWSQCTCPPGRLPQECRILRHRVKWCPRRRGCRLLSRATVKRFPLDTVCIARLLPGLPGCDTQVHRAVGPRNQPTHTGRRHTCTRRQNTETCACHCRWGSRSLFSRCRTTTTSWRALTAALPQRLLGQLACGESCAEGRRWGFGRIFTAFSAGKARG